MFADHAGFVYGSVSDHEPSGLSGDAAQNVGTRQSYIAVPVRSVCVAIAFYQPIDVVQFQRRAQLVQALRSYRTRSVIVCKLHPQAVGQNISGSQIGRVIHTHIESIRVRQIGYKQVLVGRVDAEEVIDARSAIRHQRVISAFQRSGRIIADSRRKRSRHPVQIGDVYRKFGFLLHIPFGSDDVHRKHPCAAAKRAVGNQSAVRQRFPGYRHLAYGAQFAFARA